MSGGVRYPLLCFGAQSEERELAQILNWTHDAAAGYTLEECTIDKYRTEPTGLAVAYCTVIRVPGGAHGFMERVRALSRGYMAGQILVINRHVSPSQWVASHGGEVAQLVTSVEALARSLGTVLEPDQVARLRLTLFDPYRPTRLPAANLAMATRQRERQAYADTFAEAMARGEHMPPPPPELGFYDTGGVTIDLNPLPPPPSTRGGVAPFMTILHGPYAGRQFADDDNDGYGNIEYVDAQDESMRTFAAEAAARRRRTADVPQDWLSVLHAHAEDLPEGSEAAECIACAGKRASICFVECGHQVLCDDCVRRMCSVEGAARECPLCVTTNASGSRVRSRIVRPVVSGTRREQNAAERTRQRAVKAKRAPKKTPSNAAGARAPRKPRAPK